MRPTVLSMILWLTLSGSLSRSAEPPPQPGDATLGASPPAGASVLLGGNASRAGFSLMAKLRQTGRSLTGL